LSGRRAKKPIHDGSQKNELNGYENKFIMAFFRVDLITLVFGDVIIFTLKLGEPSPWDSKRVRIAFASLTQPPKGEFG
jgi:hypothetical protein